MWWAHLHAHTSSRSGDNWGHKKYKTNKAKLIKTLLEEEENTVLLQITAPTHALPPPSLSHCVCVSLSLSAPTLPSPFFGRWYGGPRCYISLANGEQRGAGLASIRNAPSFKTTVLLSPTQQLSLEQQRDPGPAASCTPDQLIRPASCRFHIFMCIFF